MEQPATVTDEQIREAFTAGCDASAFLAKQVATIATELKLLAENGEPRAHLLPLLENAINPIMQTVADMLCNMDAIEALDNEVVKQAFAKVEAALPVRKK